MNAVEEYFKMAAAAAGQTRKFTLIIGTVKAVEGDTCTVDDYEDVRLNSIEADLESQFTIYPKIGSKVAIGRLEGEDDATVIKYSEVDSVLIKIGEMAFEMKDGKFTIKSGQVNLKSVLNAAFEQLQSAVINTPSGPGNFSPADVQVFQECNEKINQLME